MIRCPKCNATLPASYQRCQFCQTDVSQVARPVGASPVKTSSWGPAPWMVSTYYVIAGLYILLGAFSLLMSAGTLSGGRPNIFGILSGGFTLLVGLALAFKWDVFLSVIYLFLSLQMAGALLSLLLLSAMTKLGAGITILIIINVLHVFITGMMFYLYPKINEEW